MLNAILVLVCSGVPIRDVPPVAIAVSISAEVAPTLVSRMIDETDAVWADAGVTFEWALAERDHPPAQVLVLVGSAQRTPRTRLPTLGWMETATRAPTYIHVSYVNVLEMLRGVSDPNAMPLAVRDAYLGRALGRVLAHELGHYLLGSKQHARRGLMRAILTPDTLFDVKREALDVPTSVCEATAYK